MSILKKNKNGRIIISDVIEKEAIIQTLQKYFPEENGKMVILEFELDESSSVLNKKLWEISFPKDCIVGCIIRREKMIIPQGNTKLLTGDKVVLLSSQEAMDNITYLLTGGYK